MNTDLEFKARKMTLGKSPIIMEGIESEFVGHGLVFGKFMPPTNGHLHFIQFARMSCRKLTIMVCSTPDEPISGEIRYKWMKELFPDCNVVHHFADIQQEPVITSEDPSGSKDIKFFESWRDSIYKHCPGEKFDALFASEEYGFRVADIMDIKFIPVDIRRDLVPISGTEMRKSPLTCWAHLHPVIRPYFAKRIAIVGPENSGKSTLCKNLATHFNTVCAGDYTQSFLSECERQIPGYSQQKFNLRDVSTIARGQLANEESLARQCNKLLFCDGEIRGIEKWSQSRFDGQCPSWVTKIANEKAYNLYLLVDPLGIEGDYNGSSLREMPDLEDRVHLFNWWKDTLSQKKLPYDIISGNNWEKRFQEAIKSINSRIPELKA